MAKRKDSTPDDERPARGNTTSRIEQLSPTFLSLYVNDVNVMMTPWDFRLRVGLLESVNVQTSEALITVLADVRMSPPHLKKLVQVLTKQLELYEARVGPIAPPPD